MDWTHVLGIILGNSAFIIPLFLWNRSESRADYRHLEAGVNAQLTAIQTEMKDFHTKLYDLDKSFHDRLIKIEMERSK